MRKQESSSQVSSRNIAMLSRKDLIQLIAQNREAYKKWIRHQILVNDRKDLLGEVVLGYKIESHHLKMMRHQHSKTQSITLVWRGSGKTTCNNVIECIWLILKFRDIRILIASKTQANAIDFLKEIKGHFETNEKLIEIFGNLVGTERWDQTAIQVSGRSRPFKEPTVNTVGVDGAVASKHYDVIIADDLVDEDNSRTKHQREKMLNWYYKMLIPTLNPPDPENPLVGRMFILGTRYHYSDLYGHLTERQPDGTGGEMKDDAVIIPIQEPDGTPNWPEKFPKEHIDKLRLMGIIRFGTQYLLNCDAMKGEIFRYDDCQIVNDEDIPQSGLRIYMGVDLAIGEDETNDMFAWVVIGMTATKVIYVLDYLEKQLRFPEQTASIIKAARQYKPIRIGIEANAYQAAQIHNVKKEAPDLNAIPIITLKDKVTRAWNLVKHFEASRVFFRRSIHYKIVEHLVLFPGGRYKDLFDALDIAVTTSEKRVKKKRSMEVGLI